MWMVGKDFGPVTAEWGRWVGEMTRLSHIGVAAIDADRCAGRACLVHSGARPPLEVRTDDVR